MRKKLIAVLFGLALAAQAAVALAGESVGH